MLWSNWAFQYLMVAFFFLYCCKCFIGFCFTEFSDSITVEEDVGVLRWCLVMILEKRILFVNKNLWQSENAEELCTNVFHLPWYFLQFFELYLVLNQMSLCFRFSRLKFFFFNLFQYWAYFYSENFVYHYLSLIIGFCFL